VVLCTAKVETGSQKATRLFMRGAEFEGMELSRSTAI
jgi:hypothetical protein